MNQSCMFLCLLDFFLTLVSVFFALGLFGDLCHTTRLTGSTGEVGSVRRARRQIQPKMLSDRPLVCGLDYAGRGPSDATHL